MTNDLDDGLFVDWLVFAFEFTMLVTSLAIGMFGLEEL